MKIETVAEHSFCPELLPVGAKVLDLGCRGFEFTDGMILRGYKVCAVDIDRFERWDYHQIAISNYVGRAGIKRTDDPQATSICEGMELMCMDLPMLSIFTNVPRWHLIKFDIEGEEYKIIMSLKEPPAISLSIEFHLHTSIYGLKEMTEMENKLNELGYFTIQHNKYEAHGCSANYWDSVFVLK